MSITSAESGCSYFPHSYSSVLSAAERYDQRRWIFYLGDARLLLVMGATGVYYPDSWLMTGIFAALMITTWYFHAIQRYYFRVLYA